jgi:hypothetical protein
MDQQHGGYLPTNASNLRVVKNAENLRRLEAAEQARDTKAKYDLSPSLYLSLSTSLYISLYLSLSLSTSLSTSLYLFVIHPLPLFLLCLTPIGMSLNMSDSAPRKLPKRTRRLIS